jgi:hypothetical protein
VYPFGKLRLENLIDRPVSLDPAFAGKGPGGDADPEMGLATLPPAAMAGVILAFVDDFEALRIEGRPQFGLDPRFEIHLGKLSQFEAFTPI